MAENPTNTQGKYIKYKKKYQQVSHTKAGAFAPGLNPCVGAADFTFSCIGVNLQISHLSNLHCRAKLVPFASDENLALYKREIC